jgi:hypothetical protein
MTGEEPSVSYSWIDPKTVPLAGDIFIVLNDNRNGFIGWFIKAHESGVYNHAMMSRKTGMLVSQADVLKEIPVDIYLKSTNFLKFWRVKNLTPDEFLTINAFMDHRLSLPWWKRSYDYAGLIGQAFPFLRWFQMPGLNFCSEFVALAMRSVKRFSYIDPQRSPVYLDKVFKDHPDDFEVCGHWYSD